MENGERLRELASVLFCIFGSVTSWVNVNNFANTLSWPAEQRTLHSLVGKVCSESVLSGKASRYISPSEHFTRFVLKNLHILSGFTTVVVEDTFSERLREIWCSFDLSVSNSSLSPNIEKQVGRSATNYTFFLLFIYFFCYAAIFFFLL